MDGTIAYDPTGRRVFLFGGQDSSARNDLWAYSLAQRQWTEILVTGDRPTARFGHTLLFDPVRRRLLVFGGQGAGFFSDVWAFEIQSGTWRQLSQNDAGPTRRYAHSAIYDGARDRMVISHGFTNAGRFDDTWAFDLTSNSWRDLSPAGPRPLRRCLHRAIHDGGDQMYVFGGCASGFGPCPLGDLWSFDLVSNRWTERTSSAGPAARQHYGIAFDSVRRRLVLFGGDGDGKRNDTWTYDPLSSAWRQPVIAGDTPSPRSRHESAYANDRGTIFFFGGSTVEGLSHELWMLGPGFVGARPEVAQNGVANAFSFATGAVSPGEIASIFGNGLGPINNVMLGVDPLTGRLPVSGPGVSVAWNGIAAPLYFVSTNQLNVQVPYELAGASEARLVVTVDGQSSDPVTLPLLATHPGLFPRVYNEDGTANSAENAARAGSIVILYATGQGVTNPPSATGAVAVNAYPEPAAPVIVCIGGREAEVLFRGMAPGTAGVMQINVRVPEGVPSMAPVVLSVGAEASQEGVLVAVK